MTDEAQRTWRIAATPEQFAAISTDERFNAVLILGRIANSIRFALAAVEDQVGKDTPVATRQHTSSFLYLCAVLFEALEFISRSGKPFKESVAFREGLGKILKSDDTRRVRDSVLKPLRNQAVYHHDDHVMPEGAKNFVYNEYVIASGQGNRLFDVFYDLSDTAAVGFGLRDLPHPPRNNAELRPVIESVINVAHSVLVGTDRLALELLTELGLEVKYDDDAPAT